MRSEKCLNLIAPHLGSTVGRVVYYSMAAAAGAAADVSAVFAMTLAAYQQQQQRRMAVWNLIMDGYDDDTELDAENDESTKENKRRRVITAKAIKHLVGGKSYRTKTCRATPAGLPGAFAVTFAYCTVSSRSWWRW